MKKTIGATVLGAALMMVPPVDAATVMGMGNSSCGEWVRVHQGPEVFSISFSSWLSGYLSGANIFGNGTGDAGAGTSSADRDMWMTNYCRQHPTETIKTAADALISELERQRRANAR